jgi:FkbM family methyltransferase
MKAAIRKKLKSALRRLSPSLAEYCAAFWDSINPVVRGRMRVRSSIKYVLFGVCPGFAGSFTYFGTRVYFPKASAVFRLACEQGVYEPEVTAWLSRIVQPNELFIDVGANIGLISASVLCHSRESRVLSFEPSPNSVPYLQRTWRESHFMERWEIVPKAAGESAGTVRFYVAAPRYGGWDGLEDTKQAGDMHTVEIPQTTVDAEWKRVGSPKVSCVKIDVEGAESKVLSGALELIQREKPYVLLEWSRINFAAHGTDSGYLVGFAESNGYDLLTFPALHSISGAHSLEMQMRDTEMFLLAPRTNGRVFTVPATDPAIVETATSAS